MYLTIFKKAVVCDLLVYAPVDYRSLIDAELFARRLVQLTKGSFFAMRSIRRSSTSFSWTTKSN